MYPKTLPTGTSCPSLYTYRRKPLAGAETSIFTLLVSTPASGFLRYVYKEGQDVPVGKVLGYICDQAEAHLPNVSPLFDRIQGDQADQRVADLAASHPGLRPTTAKDRTPRFRNQACNLTNNWMLAPP